jgi:hypothetical protein
MSNDKPMLKAFLPRRAFRSFRTFWLLIERYFFAGEGLQFANLYGCHSLTIQPVHYFFALLVSRPFNGCAADIPRDTKWGKPTWRSARQSKPTCEQCSTGFEHIGPDKKLCASEQVAS